MREGKGRNVKPYIFYGRLAVIFIGPVVFWLKLAIRPVCITVPKILPTQMVIDSYLGDCLSRVIRGVVTLGYGNEASVSYCRYGYYFYSVVSRDVVPQLSAA